MYIHIYVGPVLGGFLIMSALSWRATFWFCFAFGIAVVLYLFLVIPETYRVDEKFDNKQQQQPEKDSDVSSQTGSVPATVNNSESNSDEKVAVALKKRRINPIKPFLMLRHPFVAMASLISGIAFGAMFAVETIIPDLLESHYGFNSWQTGKSHHVACQDFFLAKYMFVNMAGLSFLGAGVGNLTGAVVNGFLSDRLLLRARAKRGGRHKVEDRLGLNLWPAGLIFMPFGLLLFGWGIESGLTYWTAIVGFGIQNFGMNQIMTSTSAYLVDAVPGEGASATAAANLVRMVIACVLTLVANPMVQALGPGWTTVLLAALAWLSMFVLLMLKIFGARLRKHSGFEQEGEQKQQQQEQQIEEKETTEQTIEQPKDSA